MLAMYRMYTQYGKMPALLGERNKDLVVACSVDNRAGAGRDFSDLG
jgi:hypothetical protein